MLRQGRSDRFLCDEPGLFERAFGVALGDLIGGVSARRRALGRQTSSGHHGRSFPRRERLDTASGSGSESAKRTGIGEASS